MSSTNTARKIGVGKYIAAFAPSMGHDVLDRADSEGCPRMDPHEGDEASGTTTGAGEEAIVLNLVPDGTDVPRLGATAICCFAYVPSV
jgi:hypothetical protein